MMARVYFQLAGRNSVVFDFICWFFGFFASINWSDRHQSRVHPSLFFQLIFNIIISKKKRETKASSSVVPLLNGRAIERPLAEEKKKGSDPESDPERAKSGHWEKISILYLSFIASCFYTLGLLSGAKRLCCIVSSFYGWPFRIEHQDRTNQKWHHHFLFRLAALSFSARLQEVDGQRIEA